MPGNRRQRVVIGTPLPAAMRNIRQVGSEPPLRIARGEWLTECSVNDIRCDQFSAERPERVDLERPCLSQSCLNSDEDALRVAAPQILVEQGQTGKSCAKGAPS